MDFSPITQQVYGALWYLIPLAILAGVLKSPWFKGMTGEFLVNSRHYRNLASRRPEISTLRVWIFGLSPTVNPSVHRYTVRTIRDRVH